LLNHNENYKEIDREKCIEHFNTFLKKHNELIEELKQNKEKYPTSF